MRLLGNSMQACFVRATADRRGQLAIHQHLVELQFQAGFFVPQGHSSTTPPDQRG